MNTQLRHKVTAAGILLLTVLLAMGQLLRIQIGVFAAIYPHDLLISAASLLWCITQWRWLAGWLRLRTVVQKITASWIAVGVVAALLTNTYSLVALLRLGRVVLYGTFLLLLSHEVSLSPRLRSLLASAMEGFYWIFLSLGLLQYFLLPDVRFLIPYGWDDHLYRLVGTQLDPNFTGMIVVLGIGWLWQHYHSKSMQHSTKLAILTPFILALGLTYSRASFLAFLGLLFCEINVKSISRSLFTMAVLSMLFIGLATLLPKVASEGTDLLRTASISARLSSATTRLETLKPLEWVIGQGMFVRRDAQVYDRLVPDHAVASDNLFVLLLTGTGLVGLSLCMFCAWKYAQETMQLHSERIPLLVAIVLHTQFNNTLLQPFVLLIFGMSLLSLPSSKTRTTKPD